MSEFYVTHSGVQKGLEYRTLAATYQPPTGVVFPPEGLAGRFRFPIRRLSIVTDKHGAG